MDRASYGADSHLLRMQVAQSNGMALRAITKDLLFEQGMEGERLGGLKK